jgi:hypothetical protein
MLDPFDAFVGVGEQFGAVKMASQYWKKGFVDDGRFA